MPCEKLLKKIFKGCGIHEGVLLLASVGLYVSFPSDYSSVTGKSGSIWCTTIFRENSFPKFFDWSKVAAAYLFLRTGARGGKKLPEKY